ncbi:cyclohexa-1,5-dienecarbonyl-CoA hydratase [Motiliproteus sp. MSK22-1]|uniref:cyclohexa-1,5-dienecarbonyl-CoA hydratase n=1 Tax=Motiliproteus sp. MSK22-1 TaxID=1897630 RepID=UPI000977728A|nr:cyclohexa-1,5-dienecarbonyl-CoA hydratase [Motiliproteus sp. MSK22-1]OMH35337.1 cyclohexa-1,5-dienecarbonyl-CoA hydratase [Motiliproteus sp. MSK22-1]
MSSSSTATAPSSGPLKVWLEKDDRLLRLRLARPKANIVDAQMIEALSAAFDKHLGSAKLSAVLVDAEGPHFSFGASVAEHMPDQCEAMLKSLHSLIIQMLDCPVPILVAIQGQCLGGGLEVALAGNLLFCQPDANLGQPEIKLAVFAPAASCLLPERIGQSQAEDLLFSGRSINGNEALAIGLVNEVNDDPSAAAEAYFDNHLSQGSASSLRFAVKAVRADPVERIKNKLAQVEALYLQELMATHDAVEGLQAFVEKRAANWEHR